MDDLGGEKLQNLARNIDRAQLQPLAGEKLYNKPPKKQRRQRRDLDG